MSSSNHDILKYKQNDDHLMLSVIYMNCELFDGNICKL